MVRKSKRLTGWFCQKRHCRYRLDNAVIRVLANNLIVCNNFKLIIYSLLFPFFIISINLTIKGIAFIVFSS